MPPQIRPSDVFVKMDIAAILRALALTISAAPADDYRSGYCAALAAVATALSITPADVVPADLPPALRY